MSEPKRDNFDENLERLSRWDADAPQTWRAALERVKRERGLPWWSRSITLAPSAAAAVILVALGLTVAVFRVLPEIDSLDVPGRVSGTAPSSQPAPSSAYPVSGEGENPLKSLAYIGYVGGADVDGDSGAPSMMAARSQSAADEVEHSRPPATVSLDRGGGGRGAQGADATPAGPRAIVRKATLELRCDDVRIAFAKATQLLSAPRGEFLAESALSGGAQDAYATLTLRVEAGRLDGFLEALRGLGSVASEHASGEDVTAQIVDLDARIRNEQRVEQELLELLSSRTDAPLADVLKLRTAIADVRGAIERMQAQRVHLGRLTQLATVLLILRTTDAPVEEKTDTLGAYFGDAVRRAWTAGVRFVADSSAVVVAVAVGLAPWALLAALVYWLVRRLRGA